MGMLKDFAKIVNLDERQVLFLKSERTEEEIDEDSECGKFPYLLEARFYLLDGSTLSEVRLSFATPERRDDVFNKVSPEMARQVVKGVAWMEDETPRDPYFFDEDDCC